MYNRIVLAYDGTLEGRTALREGALLARGCGAQVFLLAVVSGSAGIAIADGLAGGVAVERQISDFEEILQEGVMRLRQMGMNPVAKLVMGEPAAVIGKFAKEIGADLVVVGHQKQSLLSRWWSGSTGAYILDNVNCSLLVARKVMSEQEFNALLE
jgi:nucleotide-binding universal stress UspA family protein